MHSEELGSTVRASRTWTKDNHNPALFSENAHFSHVSSLLLLGTKKVNWKTLFAKSRKKGKKGGGEVQMDFLKNDRGDRVITLVSSTRGDKGNPAARCALFRGVLERNAAVTASTWRSSRLSVCLSPCQRLVAILSRGVLTSHLPPRPPDARGNPSFLGRCLAIHTTAGLLLLCCCCCFVSLSLCLVYFRIQLHTRKSERQNRCVWLRLLSLVHLHSWGDRAAAAAAASAAGWQWSYGAHQKPGVPLRPSVAPSLFLLPALHRADQWRGGGAEGARIRWYESGVGPQTCQSHGSGANRGVRRTESAKIN